MKKIPEMITCALFAATCVGIPALGLFGSLGKDTQNAVNEENRRLREFPVIKSAEDLWAFPAGFQDWFSDHLFFKNPMVSAKNSMELTLFHELDSDRVVFGTKTPWMFNRSNDGQPLETYKGINLFTEEKLRAIAENVDCLRYDLEDAGIAFVLMISPDKEQVYGEDYMPDSIRTENPGARTQQLLTYLAKETPEVKVVYPRQTLLDAKKDRMVYYESDTHWNRIGASLAEQELARAIAEVTGNPEPVPVLYEFREGETKRGDLQKLVQLGTAYDSTEYEPVNEPLFAAVETQTDANEEIIWERSHNDNDQALPVNVYLTGDSFRWNLTRFLQDSVSDATITSRYYLDLDDAAEAEPQVFVYMIAERYLQELDMIPGYNTAALVLD